jgi:Fe-S cluster assembly scaffold protein SufB
MKEKILAFLKSKLTGVSESFLSGVADTFSKTIKEEKDIETVFSDGIIEALKFSATQLQIEGDRRATEAQKTALKNFQEKHGLNDDGTPIKKVGRPPKDKDVDPDEPVWFTAFKEEQKKSTDDLRAEIEKQKQEKTLAALSERVSKHEKLKDIPQSYLKGRNLVPKSEAEIDQLVATIEADYSGFKQEMAEKGVIISVPPTGGGQKGEKSTIDNYLDEKFPKEKEKVLTKK